MLNKQVKTVTILQTIQEERDFEKDLQQVLKRHKQIMSQLRQAIRFIEINEMEAAWHAFCEE